MKTRALGAVTAQGVQAGISFVLQVLVARWLGVEELGRFAILYGLIVVAIAVVTGFVGDSVVVLDRGDARIRAALQGSALTIALIAAAASSVVLFAVGLVSGVEAIAFALAMVAFVIEEVVRRLLMASFAFHRVAIADLSGFAVTLAIVLGVEFAAGGASLATFLFGIAIGRGVAIGVAVVLLPRDDRRLVPFQRGGFREVAGYGTWRGFQQLLRPTLLTIVRLSVGAAAGLAAVGLLEAARTYVAPVMLVIAGLTSFLFVDYARDAALEMRTRLRRADRAVGALLLLTAAMAIVALALMGWAGPLLFGVELDALSVIGWLAYASSVAAVTPYGSLAAVVGRQSRVFAIRTGDTVLSVLLVGGALWLGAEPRITPLLLAAGSLLGGLAIRGLVLRPLQRKAKNSDSDELGDGDPEP
jgi:O-antigen/teichoic acid export membrane protein